MDIQLGTIMDVIRDHGCSMNCALEIAIYRQRGCSSPKLELVMLETYVERTALRPETSHKVYVIGHRSETDADKRFVFGERPTMHYNLAKARHEQQRLAHKYPNMFALFGIVSTYTAKA